ncbi:hypothetical protein ACLB1E_13020 [Escherichia coli]
MLTHLLAHRKFLLGSFLLLAATLVVMACLPSGSSLTLLLFVLFSTTISAVSNLVGILPAESFPTDIRSLGVGFAAAMVGGGGKYWPAAVGAGAVGNASHLIAPGGSVVGWFCCDLAMGTRNQSTPAGGGGKCRRCE